MFYKCWGQVSFILKYPLGRQHLKLYFYHNVFSMYFNFESEFNGEILLLHGHQRPRGRAYAGVVVVVVDVDEVARSNIS